MPKTKETKCEHCFLPVAYFQGSLFGECFGEEEGWTDDPILILKCSECGEYAYSFGDDLEY